MLAASALIALALGAVLDGQPAPAPMSGVATAAAETCPVGAPPLPPAMAGWSARSPLAAAASSAALASATVSPGQGVDLRLRPAAEVTYAATPGRPAGPDGRAGLLALTVAAAGTYAVGLSTAAWIDMVDARGAPVASTAHGHGPPCSGLRKVVDFPLSPGRYVLQITATAPVVGMIAFRR